MKFHSLELFKPLDSCAGQLCLQAFTLLNCLTLLAAVSGSRAMQMAECVLSGGLKGTIQLHYVNKDTVTVTYKHVYFVFNSLFLSYCIK
jgi:hypothetical protein